jgi:predicted membrane GTPase involved in stress response
VAEEDAEEARVAKLYSFAGLERVDVAEATAGDIVALAGLEGVEIGKTLTDPEHTERLRGIAVEEPTLSVDFSVNNSPMAGRSGKYVTSRQVRDRLFKELEQNVALRVEETESPDTLTVSGRGELHLSILMETMRREGYEFQVSRPRVITPRDEGRCGYVFGSPPEACSGTGPSSSRTLGAKARSITTSWSTAPGPASSRVGLEGCSRQIGWA